MRCTAPGIVTSVPPASSCAATSSVLFPRRARTELFRRNFGAAARSGNPTRTCAHRTPRSRGGTQHADAPAQHVRARGIRRLFRSATRTARCRCDRHDAAGGGTVRVTLIHPPTIAAVSTFAQEAVPPLGLAYVAAAVRDAGYPLCVIDSVGLGLDRHGLYPAIPRSVLTGLPFDET